MDQQVFHESLVSLKDFIGAKRELTKPFLREWYDYYKDCTDEVWLKGIGEYKLINKTTYFPSIKDIEPIINRLKFSLKKDEPLSFKCSECNGVGLVSSYIVKSNKDSDIGCVVSFRCYCMTGSSMSKKIPGWPRNSDKMIFNNTTFERFEDDHISQLKRIKEIK